MKSELPMGARNYIDKSWQDYSDNQLASNLQGLGFDVTARDVRHYRLNRMEIIGEEPLQRPSDLIYPLLWRVGILVGVGAIATLVFCHSRNDYKGKFSREGQQISAENQLDNK
ncbi:MAG TPA: hypothetical protein VJA47_01450 [archaeon]|nr:hypothetical protein [archaeon]